MKLEDRIRYAKRALDGIALGDCFGQSFFMPDEMVCQRIRNKEILNESWYFTDDTVMAIGIYSVLERYGKIDRDLGYAFSAEHSGESERVFLWQE